MKEDLEAQIRKKIQQAQDRKISLKAGGVAYWLGDRTRLRTTGSENTTDLYQDQDLYIEHSITTWSCSDGGAMGSSTEIKWHGKTKFLERSSIESYISNKAWEARLNTLYAQAQKAEVAYRKSEERKHKSKTELGNKELKDKFGL